MDIPPLDLPPLPPRPPKVPWYLQPGWVLFLMFFALGPFALPLVWKSPRFPLWLKIALTVLTLGMLAWIISLIPPIIRSVQEQRQQLELLFPQ